MSAGAFPNSHRSATVRFCVTLFWCSLHGRKVDGAEGKSVEVVSVLCVFLGGKLRKNVEICGFGTNFDSIYLPCLDRPTES